jgi:uncharacterized protein YndB with AHSA1/START domain
MLAGPLTIPSSSVVSTTSLPNRSSGPGRTPLALEAWHTPGDASWTAEMLEHDFRVGGVKRFRFGPPGETFLEDCRYEDIVSDTRLCYAMTIARGDVRITTSMVTVEFLPRGGQTELLVTDQLVILDGGDLPSDRERGWGETLDKLTPFLRVHH